MCFERLGLSVGVTFRKFTMIAPMAMALLGLLQHAPIGRARPAVMRLSRRELGVSFAAVTTFGMSGRPAAADDAEAARLRKALATLDELSEQWSSLIIDCNYGEFRRDLMSATNKEALIDAAGSTNKAATTITMCKTTGRNVRTALGTGGADSPLTRIGNFLEKPLLIQRVEFDDAEEFQKASEKLQTLLSAADASAFLAANDFSAQTTFKQGEVPSTPNLDEARQCINAAREQLAIIVRLVGA